MGARILATVMAGLALAPVVAAADLPGTITWDVANRADGEPGKVEFSLGYRSGTSRWMHSGDAALTDLAGLTAAQLAAPSSMLVRFDLARDAGTFACEGSARAGHASGDCRFTGSAAFTATLAKRGIGTPSEPQLFTLAMSNVGNAYLAELDRQHYARPTIDELVSAADHGVNLKWLQGMGGFGYKVGSLAAAIQMRDHGVSIRYVQELADSGIKDIGPDGLVRLRDHGVSANYIASFRSLGYTKLAPDELIRMRDHGVSTGFVTDLHSQGYSDIAVEQMIRMRDLGLSPGAIRRANQDGVHRTPEELLRLRAAGKI